MRMNPLTEWTFTEKKILKNVLSTQDFSFFSASVVWFYVAIDLIKVKHHLTALFVWKESRESDGGRWKGKCEGQV